MKNSEGKMDGPTKQSSSGPLMQIEYKLLNDQVTQTAGKHCSTPWIYICKCEIVIFTAATNALEDSICVVPEEQQRMERGRIRGMDMCI